MKYHTLLIATLFLSIPMSTMARNDREDDFHGPNHQERREAIQERIHTVRLLRMIETLQLNDEKAVVVNRIASAYEEKQADLGRSRSQKLQELRDLARSQKADDKAIQKTLADLQILEEKFHANRKKELDEVFAHLTPHQQAKYVLFRQQFNQAVGDAIRRNSRGRGQDDGPQDASENRRGRDR